MGGVIGLALMAVVIGTVAIIASSRRHSYHAVASLTSTDALDMLDCDEWYYEEDEFPVTTSTTSTTTSSTTGAAKGPAQQQPEAGTMPSSSSSDSSPTSASPSSVAGDTTMQSGEEKTMTPSGQQEQQAGAGPSASSPSSSPGDKAGTSTAIGPVTPNPGAGEETMASGVSGQPKPKTTGTAPSSPASSTTGPGGGGATQQQTGTTAGGGGSQAKEEVGHGSEKTKGMPGSEKGGTSSPLSSSTSTAVSGPEQSVGSPSEQEQKTETSPSSSMPSPASSSSGGGVTQDPTGMGTRALQGEDQGGGVDVAGHAGTDWYDWTQWLPGNAGGKHKMDVDDITGHYGKDWFDWGKVQNLSHKYHKSRHDDKGDDDHGGHGHGGHHHRRCRRHHGGGHKRRCRHRAPTPCEEYEDEVDRHIAKEEKHAKQLEHTVDRHEHLEHDIKEEHVLEVGKGST